MVYAVKWQRVEQSVPCHEVDVRVLTEVLTQRRRVQGVVGVEVDGTVQRHQNDQSQLLAFHRDVVVKRHVIQYPLETNANNYSYFFTGCIRQSDCLHACSFTKVDRRKKFLSKTILAVVFRLLIEKKINGECPVCISMVTIRSPFCGYNTFS